jgi:hypothetical protein
MEWTFGHQLTLFLAGFIVVFVLAKIYFKF